MSYLTLCPVLFHQGLWRPDINFPLQRNIQVSEKLDMENEGQGTTTQDSVTRDTYQIDAGLLGLRGERVDIVNLEGARDGRPDPCRHLHVR